MSRPPISNRKLSDTLMLSECHPTADYRGKWWLWDETQGCNLAMGAETEEEALVQALEYYQTYLAKYKGLYKDMKAKVDSFVSEFTDEEDEW